MASIRRSIDHFRGSPNMHDTLTRLALREELQTFLMKYLSPEIERAVQEAFSTFSTNGQAALESVSQRVGQHREGRKGSKSKVQRARNSNDRLPSATDILKLSEDMPTTLDAANKAVPSFAVKAVEEERKAAASVAAPKTFKGWGAHVLPEGNPGTLQATDNKVEVVMNQEKTELHNLRTLGSLSSQRHSFEVLEHDDLASFSLPGGIDDTQKIPGRPPSRPVTPCYWVGEEGLNDDQGAAADIAAGCDRAPARKLHTQTVSHQSPERVSVSDDVQTSRIQIGETSDEAEPETTWESSDSWPHVPDVNHYVSVRERMSEAPRDYYIEKVESQGKKSRAYNSQISHITEDVHLHISALEESKADASVRNCRQSVASRTQKSQTPHGLGGLSRRTKRFTVHRVNDGWNSICGSLRTLVKGEHFDYFMGVFLALNAISIGVQADYLARNVGATHTPHHLRVIEVTFCVIFLIELMLRIAVHRCKFLTGKNWQWHLFDSIVVFFSVADEITMIALKNTSVQEVIESLGVLRMLRLMRVVRLVRMVRLIPELKSMVYLISASMWSFFWTVVLLILMMYCVAVYFTDLATDIARERNDSDSGDLSSHWGGVGNSILSLWMAISGGDDWRNFVDVFMGHSSYLLNTGVFSIYIAFTTLVMLNLVTGVFVEGAQRIIKEDKDSELLKLACRLFARTDKDGSYDITWEEFRDQLETKEMDDYFKAVDLSRAEAKDLFKLLDCDHSGSISIEEFVKGCLRLRGPARSVDLMALVYDVKLKNCQLQECMIIMDDNILKLAETIRYHQALRQASLQQVTDTLAQVEEYLV